MLPDFDAIDRRLLEPRLTGWEEARRIVADARGGRAAWAALQEAGRVPAALLEGDRVFVDVHRRSPPEPQPRTSDDAALCAAAAPMMLEVEAYARAVVEALIPWGQAPPRRVVWRVLPPGRLKQAWIRGEHATCVALHLAGLHSGSMRFPVDPWTHSAAVRLSSQRGRSAAQRIVAHDVAMVEGWRRSVAAAATVPAGPFLWIFRVPQTIPAALVGRSIAELPDPMTPLLSIWDAGCALHTIHADALWLCVAPPRGDHGERDRAQGSSLRGTSPR